MSLDYKLTFYYTKSGTETSKTFTFDDSYNIATGISSSNMFLTYGTDADGNDATFQFDRISDLSSEISTDAYTDGTGTIRLLSSPTNPVTITFERTVTLKETGTIIDRSSSKSIYYFVEKIQSGSTSDLPQRDIDIETRTPVESTKKTLFRLRSAFPTKAKVVKNPYTGAIVERLTFFALQLKEGSINEEDNRSFITLTLGRQYTSIDAADDNVIQWLMLHADMLANPADYTVGSTSSFVQTNVNSPTTIYTLSNVTLESVEQQIQDKSTGERSEQIVLKAGSIS